MVSDFELEVIVVETCDEARRPNEDNTFVFFSICLQVRFMKLFQFLQILAGARRHHKVVILVDIRFWHNIHMRLTHPGPCHTDASICYFSSLLSQTKSPIGHIIAYMATVLI